MERIAAIGTKQPVNTAIKSIIAPFPRSTQPPGSIVFLENGSFETIHLQIAPHSQAWNARSNNINFHSDILKPEP